MHLVKGSQLCKWSDRTYVYYRKFKSFKLTKANENTIRCMMLCFMLSCAISIFALLAGIEKKQILSVGFWLSHESFPKNEPLAKDWWGLKNGKCEFYFLYLWLWNVFLDRWKKVVNGDLVPQERPVEYIYFTCSLAIFWKFILNPSSVIKSWLMFMIYICMIWFYAIYIVWW